LEHLYIFADDPPVTKHCKTCGQDLPLDQFGNASGGGYLHHRCRSCNKKNGKILDEIKKTAPPPPPDHRCPICDRNAEQIKETTKALATNAGHATWCCDHDHATNTFRGWLCQMCNRGLGNFYDDVNLLNKCIDYLSRGKTNKNE
jgi:hypothetical protein